MTEIHPWWDSWGAGCDAHDLSIGAARGFVSYVARAADGLARIKAARRDPTGVEAVLIEVDTHKPQRPAIRLNARESVAVLFTANAARAPCVLVLRPDFPRAPHQNSTPEGWPLALCVDDRPWSEARRLWTPSELMQRIIRWFERAGMGELHDAEQPLDPFFAGAAYNIILPQSLFEDFSREVDLVAFAREPDLKAIVAVPSESNFGTPVHPAFSFVCYTLRPGLMDSPRTYPSTLASLAAELDLRGIDLLSDLASRTAAWASPLCGGHARLRSRLGIVVRMPVLDEKSGLVKREDVYAFLTAETIGEIGEALGTLYSGGPAGFVTRVPKGEPDHASLKLVKLLPALAHRDFTRDRAAKLAGKDSPDERRAVLVGAGAIGSIIAECLAREGRFAWDVVDADELLPHNLARHTLTRSDIGTYKAKSVAARLTSIVDAARVNAVVADVLAGDPEGSLETIIERAEIVIDASASIAVARHLCDLKGGARRVSAFFNPAGTAVVVIVEDEARTVDLRFLEATYYRAVVSIPDLAEHLTGSVGQLQYSGSCRAVTNRIPASRVQALSAIAAGAIGKALDSGAAFCSVWRLREDGSIVRHEAETEEPIRRTVGEWKVVLPQSIAASLVSMRKDALPAETGGVVLGVIDMVAKRIDVVDAWQPPVDSSGSRTAFKRGVAGLHDQVLHAQAKTLDQIRYVGEWHSHPSRATSAPSLVDLKQIAWLARTLALDECPGLMLIVGDHGVNISIGVALSYLVEVETEAPR